LFTKEEFDAMLFDLQRQVENTTKGNRGEIKEDGRNGVFAVDLHAELIQRVQANLRVVLCMSSFKSHEMMQFIEKYPCLESVQFKYFLSWKQDAVFEIAHTQLQKQGEMLDAKLPEQTLERVALFLSAGHCSISSFCDEQKSSAKFSDSPSLHSIPQNLIFPSVSYFFYIYRLKSSQLSTRMEALNLGVLKLEKAERDAGALERGLEGTIVNLEMSHEQQEELISKICAQQHHTNIEREKLHKEQVQAQMEADDIDRKLQAITVDLAKFEPVLERAIEALKSITPHDIHILKAMKTPPKLIKRAMDTVLILLQRPLIPTKIDVQQNGKSGSPNHKNSGAYAGVTRQEYNNARSRAGHACVLVPSWNSARDAMTEFGFLDMLVNFPKEHLNEETIELIQPYLDQADFNDTEARRASSSLAGLMTWVHAMVEYFEVSKDVLPMRISLELRQAEFEEKNIELRAAEQDLLQKVRVRVIVCFPFLYPPPPAHFPLLFTAPFPVSPSFGFLSFPFLVFAISFFSSPSYIWVSRPGRGGGNTHAGVRTGYAAVEGARPGSGKGAGAFTSLSSFCPLFEFVPWIFCIILPSFLPPSLPSLSCVPSLLCTPSFPSLCSWVTVELPRLHSAIIYFNLSFVEPPAKKPDCSQVTGPSGRRAEKLGERFEPPSRGRGQLGRGRGIMCVLFELRWWPVTKHALRGGQKVA
jgi:hypothetical protein